MSTTTEPDSEPLRVPLSEKLGLAPERDGQPRLMTIIGGANDETGHWYSPAAVREMLTTERNRWADLCGNLAAISWAEWDERADPIDRGKALALERVAALLTEGPNAELRGRQRPHGTAEANRNTGAVDGPT